MKHVKRINRKNQMLRLAFDTDLPWGSKEHYFHALHGYLLPGLHHALTLGYRDIQFEDCGPLMQPRLYQGCMLAGLNAVEPDAPLTGDLYRVPRWDQCLLHFEAPPPSMSRIAAYCQRITPLVQKMTARAESFEGGCVAGLRGNVPRVTNNFDVDTVAVIKRSEDHPFYHSPRMAAFPRYGVGRTDLLNAEEVAQTLCAQGIAAQVVEFGAMTLGEQITVANRARALVGIRGAEFANVIWMRPNTHAIMLATPVRENHGTRTLCAVKRVHFASLPVDANHVQLDSSGQRAIVQLLSRGTVPEATT